MTASVPLADPTSTPADKYMLPLVSVIVVNYNYGRFLREAVESVMAQTYPFIECVIVDDRSTDDSPTIIAALKSEFAQINVVVTEKNGGQSASSLVGMSNSIGAYIIFLDADDYLYPTCVETHMQAHLALRMPVGFTSVDMIQIRDGRMVVAGAPSFSNFVRSRQGASPDHARELDASLGLPRLSFGHSPIANLLHYVDPKQAGGWPWSPTSGNCFRRDALHLITDNEHLAALRSCTDCYLLRGVACLTGSVLIDRPLFAYRLHGKNDFVTGASLHRTVPYDAAYLKEKSNQATKLLINHLIETADELKVRLEAPVYFREALDALDHVHPPIEDSGFTYITKRLLFKRDRLRSALGRELYDRWLIQRCIPGLLGIIMTRSRFAVYLFGRFVLPLIISRLKKA